MPDSGDCLLTFPFPPDLLTKGAPDDGRPPRGALATRDDFVGHILQSHVYTSLAEKMCTNAIVFNARAIHLLGGGVLPETG